MAAEEEMMPEEVESESDESDDAEPMRGIDNDLGDETDENTFLARMEDVSEDVSELQDTIDRTVSNHPLDRVMMLEVADEGVNTAANSHQYSIDLVHPIEGEIRFFVEKPTDGTVEGNELMEVLEWYGLDSNPYLLEERDGIFVQKNEEKSRYQHGWRLVPPTSYDPPTPSLRTRVAGRLRSELGRVQRFESSMLRMYGFLLAGVVAGPLIASVAAPIIGALLPIGIGAAVLAHTLVFFAATLLGMLVLNP